MTGERRAARGGVAGSEWKRMGEKRRQMMGSQLFKEGGHSD